MEDQDTGLPARLQAAGGGHEEGSYRGVEWSGVSCPSGLSYFNVLRTEKFCIAIAIASGMDMVAYQQWIPIYD